jgi:prophage maintenance system killer protein
LPRSSTEYVVTLADVMEAHERALKVGGRAGVLSLDLVESAIAPPYTGYYPSIVSKCAAFIQSLAGNHGFTNRNKRTTLYIVDLFDRRSGFRSGGAPLHQLNIELEAIILTAAAGAFDFADASRRFEEHLNPVPWDIDR